MYVFYLVNDFGVWVASLILPMIRNVLSIIYWLEVPEYFSLLMDCSKFIYAQHIKNLSGNSIGFVELRSSVPHVVHEWELRSWGTAKLRK